MEEDTFSCIKTVIKTVHIALPSLYITNEIAGVTDILESWKRQYVPQVEGIVVSYKNVSLLSNTGYIVIDKPVVHYDVKATFEIFCPSVGSIVKGKINRISYDYIGCLIHNTINVTIKRTEQESDWLANMIAIDNIVLFQITFFDFHRRVVRVKGEITEECVNFMKEIPSFNTQTPTAVFENSQSIFNSSEDESSVSEDRKNSIIEENNTQSPSLLAPKYSFQKEDPHVFNVDHLTNRASSGDPTTSHNSESSLSETDAPTKKNHLVSKTALLDRDLGVKIDAKPAFEKSPKKKKKKKDKKSSKKVSKSKTSGKKTNKKYNSPLPNNLLDSTLPNPIPKSVKKKKPSKKAQSLLSSDLLDNPVRELKSDSAKKKKKSSSKKIGSKFASNLLPDLNSKSSKKKNKKDGSSAIFEFTSTNQKNITGSGDALSRNSIINDLIKDEIKTDSSPSPTKLQKKKKSKIAPKVEMPDKDDLESMMNALAAFEPNLDDQLNVGDGSLTIKDEPFAEATTSSKKNKKRKQESTDNENSPTKKKKKSGENLDTSKRKKNKTKKKDKSEKGNADNSKSKKDKKKKSKDQSKKSKKKIKGKEGKDKKRKSKSSKDVKKEVSAIKSEI